MVEMILAVALFVLTIAVVGLFAMMGELVSRVPDPAATTPPQPFEGATLGTVPQRWPDGIAHLGDADFGVMVVFSTSCSSCQRIAGGATGPLQLPADAAVVVSAATVESGRQFLEEHPALGSYRTAVDPGGAWLTDTLGVDMSPTVLTFAHGRLVSAHTFTSASGLGGLLDIQRATSRKESHV